MTNPLGSELPPELLDLLGSDDPSERVGFTVLLSTTSAGGTPHLALLSFGEVLAVDSRRVRLALWRSSTAADNLAARGSCGLATVIEHGSVWGIHLRTSTTRDLDVPGDRPLTMIDASVSEVRADSVGYAVVETGIRFHVVDPDSVVPRWRATRQALADGFGT